MKTKVHSTASLFDWVAVREAFRRTIASGDGPGLKTGLSLKNHDVEISVLINDVFGGEILKTRDGRGWHFYNRIDGVSIDLARQQEDNASDNSSFKGSSDAPPKSSRYVEQNDYTRLFLRFVRAFEETVGLGNYQTA